MSLADYFENTKGIGVLGTADAEGKVNLAIYARPHVMDEENVAFIMGDRTSHRNLAANPHAAYLFVEEGRGYQGLRMHLTRTREERDPEKIDALRRRISPDRDYAAKDTFLVHFRVDEVRPLVGERRPPQSPS
jgi:hypothetical protein